MKKMLPESSANYHCKITLDIGEPERAGPADGRHQGHVCQEAGDDEEDEHQCGMSKEFFKMPF